MPPDQNKSTRSRFRDSLLLSELATQHQIDEAEHRVLTTPGGPPTPIVEVTDDMLAAMLMEMEILTQYQTDQLNSGRTKLNLGPYTITDWIGQGGMGHVFKAVHNMMGRDCAIKVLPLTKSTPESIGNFRHEIRTQAGLDHPNLVRAYDAGQDGNVHFLVTEYVAGQDLRRLVRAQGPLTVQQAASVVLQACHGLDYAHRRGLIHRDVKPGNILVTPEGIAKVSDLGLAGFVNDAENDPRAGKIAGTPDYLSPEQIKTPHEITPASDVYSLGCTLYYAVTGKVPFPGGTAAEKARRHCEETPWHPRRFNPEINEEFVEIIADLMEKDPESRVQTAADVAERLESWATDISLLSSQRMTKSPWTPPPLPGADDDQQDTDVGNIPDDGVPQSGESGSQMSQGTEPVAAGQEDTRRLVSRRQKAPPLNLSDDGQPKAEVATVTQWSVLSVVTVTLAIAVPISMLVGAMLAAVISSLFGE
ncbi:MAG: serine/threonine protein kinase [Pirellulaceae bacterium]|jgi:serine/threonine protein kinase